jgi:replicative DNA helicase
LETETILDVDLERAVLGVIVQNPTLLPSIISEVGLQPRHFGLDKHRELYSVILRLHSKGVVVDAPIVSRSLDGTGVSKELVQEIAAVPRKPESARSYSEKLIEQSEWRTRQEAHHKALEAVKRRDIHAYSRATSLAEQGTSSNSLRTPQELAESYRSYIDDSNSNAMELPFPRLNQLLNGGLRRKQVTVIGGWTSHGKSIIMDQFLTYYSQNGYKTHLYINEMGEEERVGRILQRETGIAAEKLLTNDLTDSESTLVDLVLDNLPFPITECAGWSVDELIFDIKRHKFDVIGIDILHQFDFDSEQELSRISKFINRTAKLANCHILVTVHLNEARVTDTRRPRPVLRDIRGSGMIKNDADNVMFVFREQDPQTGDLLPASAGYFQKVRNGKLGYVPLVFNDTNLKFDERPDWRAEIPEGVDV